MGNCSFKGVTKECSNSIRVLTDSGGILEFRRSVMVKDILVNRAGYGVFRQGHASTPLPDQERLSGSQFYYLLPLEKEENERSSLTEQKKADEAEGNSETEDARKSSSMGSHSVEQLAGAEEDPETVAKSESENAKKSSGAHFVQHSARNEEQESDNKSESGEARKSSSAHFVEQLSCGTAVEVLPTTGEGVWKVKLAINTKQLEEILAEDVNTEALIEKMRMAAAASSGAGTPKRLRAGWKPVLSNVFKNPIYTGK